MKKFDNFYKMSETTKNIINTGNRLLDIIITTIIGALLGILLSYIHTSFFKLQDDGVFRPYDVDMDDFIEELPKFKFKINLNNYSCYDTEIYNWIVNNYGSPVSNKTKEIFIHSKAGGIELYPKKNCNDISMPVHRYTKDDKFQYIILHEMFVYTNDLDEIAKILLKCINK